MVVLFMPCLFYLFVCLQSQQICGERVLSRSDVLVLPNAEQDDIPEAMGAPMEGATFSNAMVNTKILTLFNYNGSQVYVYSAVENQASGPTTSHKWIFFYVPIMSPVNNNPNDSWVWAVENEVRVKLMLGDSTVDELARAAIIRKYDAKTAEYAKYWDIAPLMIDSLAAYVVQGSSSPIFGVEPFHAIHPNSLVMIFRFKCTNEDIARHIADMIRKGEYEIEIAFYFAGFLKVSTNFVSITGDQLRAVSSKTTADGGNTNAQYIHRSQASKFISHYMTNVQKMIYIESDQVSPQSLSAGLEETFISLLQRGRTYKPLEYFLPVRAMRRKDGRIDIC